MTEEPLLHPPEAAPTPLLPEPWPGSIAQQTFAESLARAPQRILLLDYDGTLAPFHADKMRAFPWPGVAEVLDRLYARADTRLVLVTGRPVADLPQLLPLANHIELWGSHGWEHVTLDRRYTLFPLTAEQRSTLDAVEHAIDSSLRGISLQFELLDFDSSSDGRPTHTDPIERKPVGFAVHWRGLTTESQALVRESADAAFNVHGNSSITRLPFASGVEFRAVGYTKAFPVHQVTAQAAPGTLVAYFGDDVTDEDAFAALGPEGLGFLVRPTLRASHAKYWLRPPEELVTLLDSLAS